MSSRRPGPASARVSSADATGRTADAGAKDAAAPRRAPFLWLAGALFFLSGAAGLIYESIWTRYLGLLVGHTAYAQVIVLVIFMGGMAAGALAVGRRSERLRRPLRLYALVEAAIGVLWLI